MKKNFFGLLILSILFFSCSNSSRVDKENYGSSAKINCSIPSISEEKNEITVGVNDEIEFTADTSFDNHYAFLAIFETFPDAYEKTFGQELLVKEEIPEKDDSIIYFPFFNEDYTYELRNEYINQGKTVFDYFLPEYYLYKKGFLVVPQKTEKVYNKSAFKIKYSTPGDYRVYLQFDNYYSISYKYVNISFNKYDDVKEYIIHVEE